jgi:hypothetical protein
MARPTRSRTTATTTTTTRTTRSATSRRPAASAGDADVAEDQGGLGMVDGLVIVTTLFLLLGLGTVDYFMGSRFGDGFLF